MARSILVIGGTGKQGQAVALDLLQRGRQVHIFTRDPSKPIPQKLSRLGAIIREGDLDDLDALRAATQNVEGVFLNVSAMGSEVTYASNVIETAKTLGVKHLVYSSVARAGDHESFPGWSANYPMAEYWLNKATIQDMVRNSGFESWTILQPAFFMQNFARPTCDYMFPGLAERKETAVAHRADTRLDLIHVTDIGRFAANAFESPSEYAGKTIPLAAESLSFDEIAQLLTRQGHGTIRFQHLSDEEAHKIVEQGSLIMRSQIWQKDVGYCVDLEKLKQCEGRFISFAEMIERGELNW